MATTDFNKENLKFSNFANAEQVQYQQTIIQCPQNNYIIQRSYCEILQKNKPQSNSVIGGILLLFVSGLHIGWGIWRSQLDEPWVPSTTFGLIQFILMSWYVFAIVGGIVGAVLVTHCRKKTIYYIGGAILVSSSIMFIALYKEYEAIIVGRCLAGFGHGILYNAVITHASENVVKDIRGMLLSTMNCMMFSGVFVSSTLTASLTYRYYYDDISSDVIFGIFGLVFSVLGVICTIFLTYESIPYLLRRDNESEAIVNMLKLRNESVMTTVLTNDLDEMRLMVAQDVRDNQNILTDGNASVIGKMIVLRLISTLTNNLLLNFMLINFTMDILRPYIYYMAPMILTGTRFVGSFIPVISTDFIKRKIHLTGSGVISAILMLLLAIIYATVSTYWVLAAFSIAFQFFVSIGIDPMQLILLSEAFSTSKKAWSIACVTTAEYLLQIMFIGIFFVGEITYTRVNAILFVTAGVILPLVILLQLAIPETFKKSMKEARDLFRK